jgi:hypothetical protein
MKHKLVGLNFKFKLSFFFLFSNQVILILVLELQCLACKLAQLNSHLRRSSQDRFLMNLPDVSHKV